MVMVTVNEYYIFCEAGEAQDSIIFYIDCGRIIISIWNGTVSENFNSNAMNMVRNIK